MPKYNGSLKAAVEDNQTRPCKVKGCSKPRYRIGGYCPNHGARNFKNGHPTAPVFIARRDFQDLYQIALDIIEQNKDSHKGIRFGIATIERILEAAKTDGTFLSVSLAECLREVIAKGVTAEMMLASGGALYAFSNTHLGSQLQRSDSYLQTSLGYNMLKVVPTKATPSGRVRRELGKLIQSDIAMLLITLEKSVLKRMELEERAREYQLEEIPV